MELSLEEPQKGLSLHEQHVAKGRQIWEGKGKRNLCQTWVFFLLIYTDSVFV